MDKKAKDLLSVIADMRDSLDYLESIIKSQNEKGISTNVNVDEITDRATQLFDINESNC